MDDHYNAPLPFFDNRNNFMLNQNYLKPGDLVQVISPSGCLRELDAFNKGVEIWRSRGYQVEYLLFTII